MDKKLLGKFWRNVFFLGVNSTNFANFWKNICQFLNITKLKRKTRSGDWWFYFPWLFRAKATHLENHMYQIQPQYFAQFQTSSR